MLNIGLTKRLVKSRSLKVFGRKFIIAAIFAILIGASAPFLYSLTFWGKIFPGVKIAGVEVGGLKTGEAYQVLSTGVAQPEKIVLFNGEQTFEIPLASLDFSYNFEASTQAAYQLFRTGSPFYDFVGRLKTLRQGTNLGLRFEINQDVLGENLSVISGQIGQEPIYPKLQLVERAVLLTNGKLGKDMDMKLLRINIEQNLAMAYDSPIEIPVEIIDPTLSPEEAQKFKERGEKFLGKKLVLSLEDATFSYSEGDIFDLLGPKEGYKEETIGALVSKIAKEVNRPPQNAIFIVLNGKVQEFTPAKDGVKVEEESLKQEIMKALTSLETSDGKVVNIFLPVVTTPPKITTGDVNNLGIKELIGSGSSRFKGSISSRVHNITLAASKFNSVLISPDETFSFNNSLGDVSLYTGYKQAYVIKDGKTVLGDGGGVCQVSTTLFRAALAAGLPIIERRAHSYRVSYYEQSSPVGIDATVYAPTTDLKIKNDTDAHILIQTKVDKETSTLVFELYGTSDGRVSTISKPVVTNPVPPPDDLYQDDPTLPAGTIKQVDWRAWGARAYFTYAVKKGGETIYEKTFYSNYRPWQAVFLRGTGPTP